MAIASAQDYERKLIYRQVRDLLDGIGGLGDVVSHGGRVAIKVNLTGPFLLSQAVARHMIEKNIRGSIVNTSSLIAVFGGVSVPAYAATKGGITQLTKSMCNDLAQYGIRVNAIGPGWVKTDMTAALQTNTERYKAISNRIPLGRWAEPEDLAGLAVFLASDASAYITGQVIFIDGGYMAM